ncbi:MAG: threonylcarbamoyl-AMP synthase [Candidatus Thermoplasmatota archaeon]|nr:threonylcarbamoyl-AMP synthase [Euryarchaeota archaeon]MBU4031916.1 threonylcarbamoyl-AMP synthase [Candidatus Thermoplasmatota archaeon]MBU4072192.1 threonylcarbamoyl-AMP synthase [Candidatus Thermoplasmatota archaeon]MBU4145006.1 threonylcarbamoyl-AMP synthase [Candidatus Thermoplasmatota archaeon]MBU4592020.1 threonylcarbamoyl-AMP synthase [Candidatus Thermoplasmatota archaeon]
MSRIFEWPAEKALPREFLAELKQLLDDGKIMVYPTSTLYGLGASIYSSDGIALLNNIKKRPAGMPISVMANADQIEKLCLVQEIARDFMNSADTRITAILPARKDAPAINENNDTLAVRFPCDYLTVSIIESVGPITATSANIHGVPTPVEIAGTVEQFGNRVSAYIDSGKLAGKPTTLVDYTGESPKIIREGVLSAQEAGDI